MQAEVDPEAMSEPVVTSWPRVLILIGAGIAVSLQVGKVPVALPYLQADLNASLAMSGWIVSVFGLVAALGAVLLGMTADRLGQARVAVFGLILSATAGLVGSQVADGTALLVTRVVEGLGYLLTATSMPSLIYRAVAERQRRTALALWSLFLPTGSFIMMALSGPLLTAFDWRVLWITTSVLVLAAVAPVALAARSLPPLQDRTGPEPIVRAGLRTVLRRGPLTASAAFALYAALYFIVASFLPFTLIKSDGFQPVAAATAGAGFILTNIFGNLGSSWLHGRGFRSSHLIMVGAAAAAILSPLVFSTGLPPGVRIAATLILGGFCGLIPSSLFASIPVLADRASNISTISGMLAQGSATGQLFGPPLVAAAVSATGTWNAAMPVTIILALCTAVGGRMLLSSELR